MQRSEWQASLQGPQSTADIPQAQLTHQHGERAHYASLALKNPTVRLQASFAAASS